MGGINSYLIRCCASSNNCPENHCKLRISHSSRSFTFNKINENDNQLTLSFSDVSSNISSSIININKASENVLMTLPGVNRKIAHDIILHRNKIGQFKKLEDIALVNGIGAAKFKHIKSEISIESFKMNEMDVILLNEFDIFQLTKIPGFTQALAEKIVSYREKKGTFKSMKDVLRVPGMSVKLLESIKPFIQLTGCNNLTCESTVNSAAEALTLVNRCKSNESFIKFTTQSDTEFNFFINIWNIKHDTKAAIPNDWIGDSLQDQKPTIVVLLFDDSYTSSVEIIDRVFKEKYGTDNFHFVKCNVGDNCVHNHLKSKVTVISNFHQHSKAISLNSLTEDSLTCMILTFKINYKTLVKCVTLFRDAVHDPKNEDEELKVLQDLASKLKSDSEKFFVFLCDSSLMNLANKAFQTHGFQLRNNKFDENQEHVGYSISYLWKEDSVNSQNFVLKAEQKLSEPRKNIIQHNFELNLPFF